MFTPHEIRLLRASRQMKQSEVAQKLEITKQRYSELENCNHLRKERLDEILKALGYTLETARRYLNSIPPPRKQNAINK
ncbi:MAG: hypothetical protein B6D37_10835 [Sphingobacteriales bacterium UTBCD1]|jgi:transcriptional regulator with XRE-family HTH domain|nr:MAG: hypothetical protein B6D37_10835 [Sphingobacteriales bacterium UTBCD1]